MLRHKRAEHSDISDSETLDNEEEEEEEMDEQVDSDNEDDPWQCIIDRAFELCQEKYIDKVSELMTQNDYSKENAKQEAFEELTPLYRKTIAKVLTAKIEWYQSMRRNQLYRAIERTAKRLQEEEDYGVQESYKYAVSKRKFMFDNLLKLYEPPEVSDTEMSDEQDDVSDTENADANKISTI